MEYVEVFSANGQLEADMVRLMLEASDIKVLLRGESVGAVYGLTVGPLGEVKVLVPIDQQEKAQGLIEAMKSGELEENLDEIPEDSDAGDEPDDYSEE